MKKLLLSLTVLGMGAAQAAWVDPQLAGFVHAEANARARVVALFDIAAGAENLPPPQRYDGVRVRQYLKFRANQSWQQLAAYLRGQNAFASGAILPRTLYSVNLSMAFDVSPQGLQILAQAPGLTKVFANRAVRHAPAVPGRILPIEGKVPYDWNEMGLTQLISEHPEITGRGITIGIVDTGCDGSHPALKGKVQAFFDAKTGRRDVPAYDSDTHGTHVSGTMVGGDRTNVTIGMAPEARLVATAPLDTLDNVLKAMEFILDPDGNPNTADAPRAVNNSWGLVGDDDDEAVGRAIAAWEAAGILPVFSAGNDGPAARTIGRGANHPDAFGVGATGPGGRIASFSSRGPAVYAGKELQRPDITAPGVSIRSSIPGGKFADYDGTSMSSPHVTGSIALILQANPRLTPVQLRSLLRKTAHAAAGEGSPGAPGTWNANFGFGRLDVAAAVKAALGTLEGFRPFEFAGAGGANFFSAPESVDAVMIQGIESPRTVVESMNAFSAPAEGWIKY